MKTKFQRLDANEAVYFARQHELIERQLYEKKFADLKARTLFPVNFEGGPGTKTITYRMYTAVGMAKILAWGSRGKDIPRVNLFGEEFTGNVRPLAAGYSHTLFDIQFAMKENLPLDRFEAEAAKRVIAELENRIAFNGDAEHNLMGFFSNPNIPSASVPNDGTGSSTLFSTKDADKIIRDISKCVKDVRVNSNEVEIANTLVITPATDALISSKRIPDTGMTVKEFVLKANEEIQEIVVCPQIAGKGTGGTDVMIAYNRDPRVLELRIPQDFYQRPVQEDGIEYNTDCFEHCGGLVIRFPLAINIAEGV